MVPVLDRFLCALARLVGLVAYADELEVESKGGRIIQAIAAKRGAGNNH